MKVSALAVLLVSAATVAGAQTPSAKETQAQLRKEAKITWRHARATALKEVPNGRVTSSELEREDGKLVYSYDIKVPGKAGREEVLVDATTGAVVKREHESAKTEASEMKKKQ
jgi:uncharacterized membrane protein YkoI